MLQCEKPVGWNQLAFLTTNDKVVSSMAKFIVHNGIHIASEFVPETFGRLTTIGPKFRIHTNTKAQKRTMQVCQCSCGDCDVYLHYNLANGHTKSCGCLSVDTTTERSTIHGKTKTPEYVAWASANKRCYNKNYWRYDRYGGRGIRVCDRWRESDGQGFLNFMEDMGPRPGPDYSLDRIDVNGDYCPENCRWATQKEQTRNQHTNRMLTAFGKTQCLAAWAEEYGTRSLTIHKRIKRGWDVEKAISHPNIRNHQHQK